MFDTGLEQAANQFTNIQKLVLSMMQPCLKAVRNQLQIVETNLEEIEIQLEANYKIVWDWHITSFKKV